jgi:hypothetical protein
MLLAQVDPVIVSAIDDRFELLIPGLSFLMFDIAPLQSVFEVANVECVVGLARLPEEPRRGIKSSSGGWSCQVCQSKSETCI